MRHLSIAVAFALVGLASCGPSEEQRARMEFIESRYANYQAVVDRLTPEDENRFQSEMQHINTAFELGLDQYATREDVQRARDEQQRRALAVELNLDPSTPVERILEVSAERSVLEARARRAQAVGLPATANEEVIADLEARNRHREYLQGLNLPMNATEAQIDARRAELDERLNREFRERQAQELDLPPDATEEQILAERARRHDPVAEARRVALREAESNLYRTHREYLDAQRRVNALSRGLLETATEAEIEAYEVDRVRRFISQFFQMGDGASWAQIYEKTHVIQERPQT